MGNLKKIRNSQQNGKPQVQEYFDPNSENNRNYANHSQPLISQNNTSQAYCIKKGGLFDPNAKAFIPKGETYLGKMAEAQITQKLETTHSSIQSLKNLDDFLNIAGVVFSKKNIHHLKNVVKTQEGTLIIEKMLLTIEDRIKKIYSKLNLIKNFTIDKTHQLDLLEFELSCCLFFLQKAQNFLENLLNDGGNFHYTFNDITHYLPTFLLEEIR
jgi:hypothetical protein